MTLFARLPSGRRAASPFIDQAIWPLTTTVDELGRLCVGGMAMTEVAEEFGTPTYVIDEADFRHRIRSYGAAVPKFRVVYAGKALLSTAVARWVAEEGACLGVGSAGELATALIAGVNPNQIVLHGKAIRFDDLCTATRAGIGRIVGRHPERGRISEHLHTSAPTCSGRSDTRHGAYQIRMPPRSSGYLTSRCFT